MFRGGIWIFGKKGDTLRPFLELTSPILTIPYHQPAQSVPQDLLPIRATPLTSPSPIPSPYKPSTPTPEARGPRK